MKWDPILRLLARGSEWLDRGAYWLDCCWSLLKAPGSPTRSAHAVTVYFHGVLYGSEERFLDPQEGITPEFLRKFIRSMKEAGYVFVTPDVAFGPNRPAGNLAMLTSDDGYCSVEKLLPVLEAEAAPLTVFVCTEYSRRNGLWWWDQIYIKGESGFRTRSLLKHTVTSREERDTALQRLGIDPHATAFSDSHRLLSPERVGQLSGSPYIWFGNHTKNHMSLPLLQDSLLDDEIEGARTDLESWARRAVQDFAFPYGDCDARSLALLRRVGYRAVFTTAPGHFVLPSADASDTHVLPRYRLRADRSARWQARIMRRGITAGTGLQTEAIRRIKALVT